MPACTKQKVIESECAYCAFVSVCHSTLSPHDALKSEWCGARTYIDSTPIYIVHSGISSFLILLVSSNQVMLPSPRPTTLLNYHHHDSGRTASQPQPDCAPLNTWAAPSTWSRCQTRTRARALRYTGSESGVTVTFHSSLPTQHHF